MREALERAPLTRARVRWLGERPAGRGDHRRDGLAAKMERLATRERIAAARERVAAAGGRWGRPARTARLDVKRAVALPAEGRSVRQIAVALNVPRSTVARALARDARPPP